MKQAINQLGKEPTPLYNISNGSIFSYLDVLGNIIEQKNKKTKK